MLTSTWKHVINTIKIVRRKYKSGYEVTLVLVYTMSLEIERNIHIRSHSSKQIIFSPGTII